MFTVWLYQIKLLRRDWLVRLFLLVVLLIPVIFYFGKIYLIFTPAGLSSADPFLFSFLFNSIQPFFILFMAYDLLKEKLKLTTLDVIYFRPVSNFDYFAGKALGVITVVMVLNVIVLFMGLFLQLFWSENPLRWWSYPFYLVTLTFPTLCFWLGLSMFIGSLMKSKGGTLLILLLIWGISCFYLPEIRHGLFDYAGREIPNIFSEITGHPFLWPYILHRLAYLFAGVGLGILGIVCCKRKSGNIKEPAYLLLGGCLLCVCAVFAGNWYDQGFRERDARRETYREVYRKYSSSPVVKMLSNDIACRQVKDSLYGSSRMEIRNPTDQRIADFILYLNPFLSITSCKEKEIVVGFTREKQIVIVKRALAPGESLFLEIDYAGKIDDAFCYLELGDVEYDHRELDTPVEKLGVGFRYGNLYSYLSDRFTLLYPECQWYPAAVAPENPGNPLDRQFDYSRYSLSVEKREGLLIVSQGKREEEEERSIFRSRDNLPGIALCIGDLGRKRIEIDSIELEWYYFRSRDWGDWELPLSFEQKKEIFESSSNFYERCCQKPYLFKEFKVVEVPASFAAHQRKWNNNNNYNQPGLVFLPERFAIMSKVGDITALLDAEKMGEYDDLLMRVKGCVESLFQGEMNNVASLLQDFTGFISDRRYPALGILLKYAQIGGPGLDKYFSGALIKSCIDYLSARSLDEACRDRTLSTAEIDCMLYLSADYFRAYLTAYTGEDTFYSFLDDFLRLHLFETVDFGSLCNVYEDNYNVDLGAIVARLYSRKGLPLFKVTGVKAEDSRQEIEWSRDKVLHFKVFNDSDVEGVISILIGGTDSGYSVRQMIRSFLLKPGECKAIRCSTLNRGDFQDFMTHLSRNFPLAFRLSRECIVVAGESGAKCQQSDFLIPVGEIIVDDRDTNFRVLHLRNTWRLSGLFGRKRKYNYQERFPMLIKQWTPLVGKEFYGDSIRSGYCKTAGHGGNGVEWRAFIDKSGMYEVFTYISDGTNIANACESGTTYFYTVRHAGGETEVALTFQREMFGWISLGEFRMEYGMSSVVLDDRVSKDSSLIRNRIPALLVADAVKWKYKGK